MVRILGVDPGTRVVGYGCLEVRSRCDRSGGATTALSSEVPMAHRVSNLVHGGQQSSVEVLGAGALRLGGSQVPIEQRLGRLAVELRRLLAEFQPTKLALEEAFFGKSVQSALRVGEARGVVLAEAFGAGLAVEQYPPAKIKRVVTGSGAASKDRVAQMVQWSLRLPSPPETTDVTDALAVGLCCIEENRKFHYGAG